MVDTQVFIRAYVRLETQLLLMSLMLLISFDHGLTNRSDAWVLHGRHPLLLESHFGVRLFSYVGQDTETFVILGSPDILTRTGIEVDSNFLF